MDLYTLINESVLFRGILAVMLVTGAIFMAVQGFEVPDWYVAALGTAMGYFFGAPTPTQIVNRIKAQQS